MSKLNLTSEECINSVKEYISELDDMEYAINNLQWEMEPTKIQLLNEASAKISEAVELLQQCLQAPEKTVIEY